MWRAFGEGKGMRAAVEDGRCGSFVIAPTHAAKDRSNRWHFFADSQTNYQEAVWGHDSQRAGRVFYDALVRVDRREQIVIEDVLEDSP